MTESEMQQRILTILSEAGRDELERAKEAFGGYTEEQLQKPYGLTKKTCGEVYQEVEDYRKDIEQLEAYLKRLFRGTSGCS